jgi:hypothetical protein
MRTTVQCVTLALAMLSTAAAQAHFVWIGVEPDASGKPAAQVWFGEAATPGEADLIGRVAKTEVSVRGASGSGPALTLKEVQNAADKTGALVAPVADANWQSVEAVCDYGVITRGDKPFLLQYYAKHLRPGAARELEARAASDKLPLVIVPLIADGQVRARVLWKGKAAAGVQVIVHHSPDDADEFTTDAQGEISFKPNSAGLLGIRARLIEEGRSGERDGQKYDEARHYSTLTLVLPQAKSTAQADSASKLLLQASQARAVWSNFPGFTAQLAIHTDEHSHTCQVRVSADGEVTLDGAGAADQAVLQSVQSLVSHRLAGPEQRDQASFVDEQQQHPLGRLIKLDSDEEMHSAFRVRGDVLTQVNRAAGESRFTINVIDVTRNAEGKYLPHVYSVSYWDAASGALRSASTSFNTWTRVGQFDLPATVISVGAQQSVCRVKRLEFSGHKLLQAGARVAAQ